MNKLKGKNTQKQNKHQIYLVLKRWVYLIVLCSGKQSKEFK